MVPTGSGKSCLGWNAFLTEAAVGTSETQSSYYSGACYAPSFLPIKAMPALSLSSSSSALICMHDCSIKHKTIVHTLCKLSNNLSTSFSVADTRSVNFYVSICMFDFSR